MRFLLIPCLLLGLNVFAAPIDKAKLQAPLPANLWIEMSKITQPAVVGFYIDIDFKNSALRRDPFFDFLEEFFGQEAPDPGDPSSEQSKPIGTGFIIDKEGHIVTNYHVIEAVDETRIKAKLRVKLQGIEELHDVEVLGRDPRGDIALLKLKKKPPKLTPLIFGDSDKLQVGEYVAAFGNPYGHSNSMTVGIVSAKGRTIKELNRVPFIQTDASINPGNSGGPLLNTKGYVVAMNTAIDARAQGIGFAVPANYVKKVVNILKTGGTIERGFLGVGMRTITPRFARQLGIKKTGVIVNQVQRGYPADKAGIQENDIIYSFNNKKVRDSEQFTTLIQDSPVGESIAMKVLRPSGDTFKDLDFQVTLTRFPGVGSRLSSLDIEDFQEQKAPHNLGFSIVSGTNAAREKYEVSLRAPGGPIITSVRKGGPASVAGIDVGDVILKVNRREVNSPTDVLKRLRRGKNKLVLYGRSGRKILSIKSE
ncbi:MAG: trypsin-like peptidase domain-containing protein [Pseudomonadota bacterium]